MTLPSGLPVIDQLEIPAAEFQRRVAAVQAALAERGVDLGFGYATPAMPGDVRYLSGVEAQLENTAFVISANGLYVVGGPEGESQAADMQRAGVFRSIDEFRLPGIDYPGMTFPTLRQVIAEAMGGERPRRAALLTALDIFSAAFLPIIRQSLPEDVDLVQAPDIVRGLRFHKSPEEMKCIRTSNRIVNAAFSAMLPEIRPGVRELEVAAIGDYVMKKLGADGFGFHTMVLSGPRINTNIGNASNKVIQDSEIVMVNIAARYNGYCSAIGRTLIAGTKRRDQVEFLDHGVKAHELAVKRLVPGEPAKYIDLAAREALTAVGLGPWHIYSVGHGTGLSECQEAEPATRHSEWRIPSYMAMMIDVGVFGHPQFHGARHEDSFLVNDRGEVERLTEFPMRLY